MNRLATPLAPTRPIPTRSIAAALLLFGLAESAHAAAIIGSVMDVEGRAMANVPVCLKLTVTDEPCLDLQLTGRNGEFRFRGRKLAQDHVVEVFEDKQATTRRYNSYGNYSWAPPSQTASLSHREEELHLEPFVGKFNFRNFQRVVQLTAKDFPELPEFDLAGEYVVLKVSHESNEALQPPNIIFLGQVTDASRVSLEASVPSATEAIEYEIYNAHRSTFGRILLAADRGRPGRKARDLQNEKWGDR